MGNLKFTKEVNTIYDSLLDRINEALQKENWNPAYELAFEIGLKCDIAQALNKTKLQKNKDFEV